MTKSIRQIRIEGNIAYVPLTQGYEAIIDASDVPAVEGFNWHVAKDRNSIYAKRKGPAPKRKTIKMHRVIMNDPNGIEVDHKDGNGLNNRRENLREATPSQNRHNQRRSVRNTSGYRGVTWSKVSKKWRAQIAANGKLKHLGLFDSPHVAHEAYKTASEALHGEFGRAI